MHVIPTKIIMGLLWSFCGGLLNPGVTEMRSFADAAAIHRTEIKERDVKVPYSNYDSKFSHLEREEGA